MNRSEEQWRPTSAPGVLERRARMLGLVREFFAARGVIEVETPALTSRGVSDPQIASLTTSLAADGGKTRYLHTSPEYAMKRLLAAGAPDIYQICRVFRDGEIGRLHQPEFTMVEWYRRGATLDDMIAETCAFITAVGEWDRLAIEKLGYRDVLRVACGIDPLTADAVELADCAARTTGIVSDGLRQAIGTDRTAWLDLLISHVVTPGFAPDRLTVLHHYPAEQAALARLDPADPALAERFEVFFGDIELANGYRELTDATEQRRRFAADGARRRAAGLPVMEPDHALLASLAAGLPECSGVALGFDRLVMTACGLPDIRQAVCFALERLQD